MVSASEALTMSGCPAGTQSAHARGWPRAPLRALSLICMGGDAHIEKDADARRVIEQLLSYARTWLLPSGPLVRPVGKWAGEAIARVTSTSMEGLSARGALRRSDARAGAASASQEYVPVAVLAQVELGRQPGRLHAKRGLSIPAPSAQHQARRSAHQSAQHDGCHAINRHQV